VSLFLHQKIVKISGHTTKLQSVKKRRIFNETIKCNTFEHFRFSR